MKIRITKNHVDALCVLIGVLGMGSMYFQVLRMPLLVTVPRKPFTSTMSPTLY